MQKVELTGPFEITCNKVDAQAYTMRLGELLSINLFFTVNI